MTEKARLWIRLLSIFGVCAVATYLLARYFGIDSEIAMLAVLVVAYIIADGIQELQHYRLRGRLQNMTAKERRRLARDHPEARYALRSPGTPSPWLTTRVGVIVVNGPIIPIMLGPLFVLQKVINIHDPLPSLLCLLLGFCLAWTWWSVSVTGWRWWATAHRGMSKDEVQWRGESANLLWPRYHFLAKTELTYVLASRKRNQLIGKNRFDSF